MVGKLLALFKNKRIAALSLASFIVLSGAALTWAKIDYETRMAKSITSSLVANETQFNRIIVLYSALNQKIKDYLSKGVDASTIITQKNEVKKMAASQQYTQAINLLNELDAQLDALLVQKQEQDRLATELAEAEAEKLRGDLKGKVTEGITPISSATVSLLNGATTLSKATTDKDGNYTLHYTAGKYSVSAAKSGYNTLKKTNIEIKAQQSAALDFSLTKYTATPPPPQASSSSSTANSTYTKTTVNTSNGSFSVDMMTVNLGPGKAQMITDTASDNDCSDNCPVKSLQSYISLNSGFAGINGTYFCPSDYSACAGKVNTFYWKIYNTRLKKVINANNGAGEEDPAIVFTTSGVPKFYRHWYDYTASGTSITAGINSKPALIDGGQNVLDTNQLDSKQKTVKSNRGALGLKGSTLYAVVAKAATVIDLAEIMKSLGVDSAMNIDGGGSSALYYNGGYKVGPGRSLPNAVIFKE